MQTERYDYSPIVDRPVLRWPGDARLAVATRELRQFLAHDDYSVFRKGTRPAPTSYPR